MRAFAVITVVLALGACSPTSPPPAASASSSASSAKVSAPDRSREAAAMAAHPGYARREGKALTITFNGKDVARLTDTTDQDCDCTAWTFAGATTLQSASGVATYAWVRAEDEIGAARYAFIGDERGLTWFNDSPLISPSGQYILAGRLDDPTNAYLTLTDWASPYPHTVYDFGAGCVPLKWLSDREAEVRCDYPRGNEVTAKVQLFRTEWRLTVDNRRIQATGKKMKYPILIAQSAPAKSTDPAQLKTMGLEWLSQEP